MEARIAPFFLVDTATSETVLGVVPLVNPEGQMVFNSVVRPYWLTWSGKAVRSWTYAAWIQSVQVMLVGTEVRVMAFCTSAAALLMERVPNNPWTLLSVWVTHNEPAELSLRHAMFLAVG